MDERSDLTFMEEAYKEAILAFEEGEVPVGAVVVIDGKVVGRGHNRRESKNDVTSHAEIEAIKDAEKALGNWRLGEATIYVTLEPCLMCAGAIIQSHIKRIVFGSLDEERGAIVSKLHVLDAFKGDSDPLVSFGIMDTECSDLLSKFFKKTRSFQK